MERYKAHDIFESIHSDGYTISFNPEAQFIPAHEADAEIDEAHKLLREGMEISKPKVKQLDMAVWRQAVKNYLNKGE